MKKPNVELSDCIRCEVCVTVSPAVFRLNDVGFIEIVELTAFPEDEVEVAIKNCPAKCIFWDAS